MCCSYVVHVVNNKCVVLKKNMNSDIKVIKTFSCGFYKEINNLHGI